MSKNGKKRRLKIAIADLKVSAVIGVLESEREKEQPILVKAAIEYDFAENAYIDYRLAAETVERTLIAGEFELLETAAIAAAKEIFKLSKRVKKVKISLEKSALGLGFSARVKLSLSSKNGRLI